MGYGYYWYKEHGICTRCHVEDAIKGQTRCANCAEIQREKSKERYQQTKEYHIAYSKRWSKATYEERKSSGICVRCGKRPPQDGKLSCTQCLIKQAKYKENSFRRKGGTPRWLAIDIGLCAVCCKNPKMKDKKVCQSCYDSICNGVKKRMVVEVL